MSKFRSNTREFRTSIGKPCHSKPTIPSDADVRLAVELVLEEALELAEACFAGKEELRSTLAHLQSFCRTAKVEVRLPSVADALADIKYVTFGAEHAFGINGDLIWDIVHSNNMLKVSGPDDPVTGKRQKPAGFVGPGGEIRQSLIVQGWEEK